MWFWGGIQENMDDAKKQDFHVSALRLVCQKIGDASIFLIGPRQSAPWRRGKRVWELRQG